MLSAWSAVTLLVLGVAFVILAAALFIFLLMKGNKIERRSVRQQDPNPLLEQKLSATNIIGVHYNA
jgi:Na+-transporting methylmalonyl-CoA/oxaloacetate decarboxylase gamma subunit